MHEVQARSSRTILHAKRGRIAFRVRGRDYVGGAQRAL
jgi:hypothetical protein